MDASLYAYPPSDRAWVRSNFVTTIDGSVTDETGVSGSLGGAADLRAFTIMRSLADVVLVGAGTARAEGYGPVDPANLDATLPHARVPTLAVVTRSLDVPERLCTAGVLVITTRSAEPTDVTRLESAGVEVLQHGRDDIDWPAVMADLASRGLLRVLCEGGPGLHGELVAGDLIDEVCLTTAPVLTTGGPGITRHDATVQHDMRLAHAVVEDGVLLTRWLRDR
ncbi:dihydrofolate reductase family protein [Aeromicrobium sp. CF4.19]|uniref:dihydrofolate reductase family protein n=1 Tax=Aeromicrobium sp. CF4.19 TaxID=3373082 RepID=UPI003EE56AB0